MDFTIKEFWRRPEVNGFTIDGRFSRDLDDAIWLNKKEGGCYEVLVSIADVSSLVEIGSADDQRALERVCTRYYRESSDPMIRSELSENKLSLLPGEFRPTITISVLINDQLKTEEVKIYRTKMKSIKRFHYAWADAIIKNPADAWHEMLVMCSDLAQKLLNFRQKNGALIIHNPNTGWAITEEGHCFKMEQENSFLTNVIIQEFMVLANQSVALWAVERGIPLLFRNHKTKQPSLTREQIIGNINGAFLRPELFDVTDVRSQISNFLERAFVGPTLEGHFGLNLDAYCHFTSPIRRYSDLINHRIIMNSLNGDNPLYSVDQLMEISNHINNIENEIKDKRKELFKKTNNKDICDMTPDEIPNEEFGRAIELLMGCDQVPELIAKEIGYRIYRGCLAPKDLFNILFSVDSQDDSWANIRIKALEWLRMKGNVKKAIDIFNHAYNFHGWGKVIYEINKNHYIFKGSATIKIGNEVFSSDLIEDIKKKDLKSIAAFSLLKKILGIDNIKTFMATKTMN